MMFMHEWDSLSPYTNITDTSRAMQQHHRDMMEKHRAAESARLQARVYDLNNKIDALERKLTGKRPAITFTESTVPALPVRPPIPLPSVEETEYTIDFPGWWVKLWSDPIW